MMRRISATCAKRPLHGADLGADDPARHHADSHRFKIAWNILLPNCHRIFGTGRTHLNISYPDVSPSARPLAICANSDYKRHSSSELAASANLKGYHKGIVTAKPRDDDRNRRGTN